MRLVTQRKYDIVRTAILAGKTTPDAIAMTNSRYLTKREAAKVIGIIQRAEPHLFPTEAA